MNILKDLQLYAGKYQVVDEGPMDDDMIAAISSAVVKQSNYGLSVCLYLRSGGQSFIPVDKSSSANVGDVVDLHKCTLVELRKDGESKSIYKIRP